jgi:hypothetical protein
MGGLLGGVGIGWAVRRVGGWLHWCVGGCVAGVRVAGVRVAGAWVGGVLLTIGGRSWVGGRECQCVGEFGTRVRPGGRTTTDGCNPM